MDALKPTPKFWTGIMRAMLKIPQPVEAEKPIDRNTALRLAFTTLCKELKPAHDDWNMDEWEAWVDMIGSAAKMFELKGRRALEFFEACGMYQGVEK